MKRTFKRFLPVLLGGIFTAVLLLVPVQLCLPAYAAADEAECWAVIVGVSNYQKIGDLNYADDNAEELFQLLSPAWGEEHLKLLLDGEATKTEIRRALEWLASNEDANDTVLFYFAGHGDPQGYIAPCNAYYEQTWISSSELSSWLRPLESEKIVIILETCHAGRFETGLSNSGRVVIMASRSDEGAWETSYLENSVFTYYLLEALSEFGIADDNFDYELSAEEIFHYAEPETVQETSDFEDTQHPQMSDQYSGELSLLVQFVFASEPNLPSGAEALILDNQHLSVPVAITWAPGSVHDLTLISPLDTGDGTRYIFSSWNDGNTSVTRTISQGGVYTANYNRQYELRIESAFGETEGQGWYDEGSMATFSAPSSTGLGIRYVFTGWSGDYSGASETASLTMSSPKTVTANWRTDLTQLYIFIAILVVAGGAAVTVLMIRRRKKAVAPARVEDIAPPTEQPEPRIARFCGRCGNPIQPEDAFCARCGKSLKE
jgi:hypothetical protein